MNDRASIEQQRIAISIVRQRHFRELIGAGLVRKVMAEAHRRSERSDGRVTRRDESMPIVLGSEHPEGRIHLFIGLQVVVNSGIYTQIFPVGSIAQEGSTELTPPFDEPDLHTVEGMYRELAEVSVAAPDYNLETGTFKHE